MVSMQDPLMVPMSCSVASKSDISTTRMPGSSVRILLETKSRRTWFRLPRDATWSWCLSLVAFPGCKVQALIPGTLHVGDMTRRDSITSILLLTHTWTKALCWYLNGHFVSVLKDCQCHSPLSFSQMCFTMSENSRTFSNDIQIIQNPSLTNSIHACFPNYPLGSCAMLALQVSWLNTYMVSPSCSWVVTK